MLLARNLRLQRAGVIQTIPRFVNGPVRALRRLPPKQGIADETEVAVLWDCCRLVSSELRPILIGSDSIIAA